MRKSVSKSNYLPKLSLVALAIATVNSAFAVECTSPFISIIDKKDVTLAECKIDVSDIVKGHYGIEITNSQNVALSNNHISLSDNNESSWTDSLQGISVEDSSVNISNTNINMNLHRNGNLVRETNSAVNVNGGRFILKNSDKDRWVSAFELTDSTLSLKNTQLSSEGKGLIDVLQLENSTVYLDNVKIVGLNESTIFTGIAQEKSDKVNHITVNNSVLVSSDFLINSGDIVSSTHNYDNLKLILNNTTVKTPILATVTDHLYDSDENEETYWDIENHIDITAHNSQINGLSGVEPNTKKSTLNITLHNSNWSFSPKTYTTDENEIIPVNPSISNLILGNSNVELAKSTDFYTFTIGNLSGNGNFSLNTDLANQKSDQIVITGKADGSHTLAVHNSDNEPQSANGKVTLVKTAGNGDATFRLKDRDYVDAGAYRYRLNKESNDWVLSNREAEAVKKTDSPKPAETVKPTEVVKPSEPVKPVESEKLADTTKPAEAVKPAEVVTPTVPVNPTIPNDRVVLSEKSNALVSLRQAQLLQLEQGLVGIHQRLGELKQGVNGNVWIRNLNSKSKFDSVATASNSHSSGFEQRYHGVQVGADQAISDNLRLGGFVGRERSNVDFKGDYGSGKLTGNSVGLYATYHNASGLYLDNIAKFSRLKSTSNATGSRHYNAYTLSSEIGKIYQLANQWSITPNAQAVWNTISGKNDEDRLNAFYTRLGVRVANTVEMGSWSLQPYAEVNGISVHNKHNKVGVNQYQFDVASSKGRIEMALGMNMKTGNHRLGLEAKTTNGKYVDQPFVVQAVYRYQW